MKLSSKCGVKQYLYDCNLRKFSHALNSKIIEISHTKSNYIQETQSLNQLQANKTKYQCQYNDKLIEEAFKIYNKISVDADHFAINPLLKLCLKCQYPQKILSIWNDIKYKQLNKTTHSLLIQCCIKTLNIDMNKTMDILKTVHQFILNDTDVYMKTSLIKIYSQCPNQINKALEIFNSINDRNKSIVCIGAIIKCCINSNADSMAISIYDKFNKSHDDVTHLLGIKACINTNNLSKGLQIIEEINKYDGKQNIKLKNTLIDFYGHFGDMDNAKHLFNEIADSDINTVCIGAMMKAYIKNKCDKEALSLYKQFDSLNNDVTHLLAIKACINTNNFENGKMIIDNKLNLNSNNHRKNHIIELQNTVINFYGHFGDLENALNVFNHIKKKNMVVINCMMQAYINNKQYKKALLLYNQYNTLIHSEISHMLALKACINTQDFETGKSIHNHINRCFDQSNLVQTTLIDFYGHFGDVITAENIFNLLPDSKKDVVCIGAMMKCLVNNGENRKALLLYDGFKSLNDNVSHILALKACINIKDFIKGQYIIDSLNMMENKQCSIELLNTLIDFYGESNEISKAENIFNSIPDIKKDIVAINAMMNAYFENELNMECIQLFRNLDKFHDLVANKITYAIVLKACTHCTSLHFGQEIHQSLNNKLIENDLSIQINLINMYGKGGMIEKCEEIFNEIKMKEYDDKYCKEISIWNIMIHCYARNGDMYKAKETFNLMINEIGLLPDRKTYILLINACSYCGNTEEAIKIWKYDINDNNIKYDEYVVSTMIDCLSRNGDLNDAHQLIIEYDKYNDNKSNEVMWMTLLNGCRVCRNKEMAEICYNQFVNRFGTNTEYMTSASVLLANIHALFSDINETNEYQMIEK